MARIRRILMYSIAMAFLASTAHAAPIVITNVMDFSNQSYTHVDLESPLDNATAINDWLSTEGVGARFTSDFTAGPTWDPNAGYDGGAVSGVNCLTGNVYVSMTFDTPVDAFGVFFGGLYVGGKAFSVYAPDDSLITTVSLESYLVDVPDDAPYTEAINGFLGVDGNGQLIGRVEVGWGHDFGSLDSFFFGNAVGGANGPGAMGFPENTTAGGFSSPDGVPQIPEPATIGLLALGSLLCLCRTIRRRGLN